MKRILALFLALIMLLSVTACGKGDTDGGKDKPAATSSAAATTSATVSTAPSAASTADTTATTEDSTTQPTDSTAADTSASETTSSATSSASSSTQTTTSSTTPTAAPTQPTTPAVKAKLNGVSLSEYTIVMAEEATGYADRAADYIRDEIRTRTGAELKIVTDDKPATAHEIVVGETNRPISQSLNAKTEGLEFSMMAKDGHVAMEGDYFIIAAAAYYFVTTYITGKNASTTVPATVQICEPIQEKANNYILLIGDGMGITQTKLPEIYDLERFEDPDLDVNNYTDNENFFYGYLFPYSGYARTQSLNGVTDSAAAGTALATGYKTTNGRIGKDKDGNNLKSLTELAAELGMSTAVMSTEGQSGATPASFSAHQDARDMYDEIKADQAAMTEQYGTIVECGFDHYIRLNINYNMRPVITDTLNELNKNEKGFFMMYEEAHIDKHCHNQDMEKTTWAVYRFNLAIAMFMEFAFYNPDTAIIITADHETGGLTDMAGVFKYAHGNHTAQLVPVLAYGIGTEVFHDKTIENVQIPKTIAKMWGQSLAADTDEQYPPLN